MEIHGEIRGKHWEAVGNDGKIIFGDIMESSCVQKCGITSKEPSQWGQL